MKIAIGKMFKSHHCWWKNTTDRLVNISLLINFFHKELICLGLGKWEKSCSYWGLHASGSTYYSKYIRDIIWGVKVERNFRFLSEFTTFAQKKISCGQTLTQNWYLQAFLSHFLNRHTDFLKTLLIGLSNCIVWDFQKFPYFCEGSVVDIQSVMFYLTLYISLFQVGQQVIIDVQELYKNCVFLLV